MGPTYQSSLIETKLSEVGVGNSFTPMSLNSELKEKLEASLGEQRKCLARNMRLSVQGTSIDQDSLKVGEINLPEDAVIQMIRVQDSTMTIKYVINYENVHPLRTFLALKIDKKTQILTIQSVA